MLIHTPTTHLVQVLAFSATYTPELLADLEPLMKRPQRVMLCGTSQGQQGEGEGAGEGEGDAAADAVVQGAAGAGDTAAASGKAAGVSGGVGLLGVRQFYAVVGAEKGAADGGGSGQQGRQGGEGEEGAGERGGLSVVAPDVFRAKVLGLLRLLGSVSFHQVGVEGKTLRCCASCGACHAQGTGADSSSISTRSEAHPESLVRGAPPCA